MTPVITEVFGVRETLRFATFAQASRFVKSQARFGFIVEWG